MRWVGPLLFALLCLPRLAYSETRFALLVGHNFGDLHESPLRWAESDAKRIKDVLTEIGEVRADRAIVLTAPSLLEFREAMARMEGRLLEAKNRGERTSLFFYFSGHADREQLHLAREKIDLEELKSRLRSGPATAVVSVIDACRNDRTPRVKEKGAVRAPGFRWPSEAQNAPEGFVFLASAAEGEVAQESDDLQGSLFTHHLLSGMRGSADKDRDGTVTLEELYRYGYGRTLADTHGQTTAVQHSEMDVALSGRGQLIVTYPRRAGSLLELGPDLVGHLLIIDDNTGRIVVEVHRSDEGTTPLAVPQGRYRIQLRGSDEIRSGLVTLAEGTTRVRLEQLSLQPALAVLSKGPGYDPAPYVLWLGSSIGSSLVEGFDLHTGLQLGLDYRVDEALRAGVGITFGYASADSDLWELRQLELGAAAGIDFAAYQSDALRLIVGARAGIAAVVQNGDRTDAARLVSLGIDPSKTESSGETAGPKIGALFGVEVQPWTKVGLRLAIEPSLWWLSVADSHQARTGVHVTLATLVRM